MIGNDCHRATVERCPIRFVWAASPECRCGDHKLWEEFPRSLCGFFPFDDEDSCPLAIEYLRQIVERIGCLGSLEMEADDAPQMAIGVG